jgi:hypothetical protein
MKLASQGLGHDFRTAVRNMVSPRDLRDVARKLTGTFQDTSGENRLTAVL